MSLPKKDIQKDIYKVDFLLQNESFHFFSFEGFFIVLKSYFIHFSVILIFPECFFPFRKDINGPDS